MSSHLHLRSNISNTFNLNQDYQTLLDTIDEKIKSEFNSFGNKTIFNHIIIISRYKSNN